MVKIYYEKDANLGLLAGKVIGITGYGSQGHAHAQNLRDSGVKVIVSELKDSPGWKKAKKAGFEVTSAEEMAAKSDIIVMLVQDNLQKTVYEQYIVKNLTKGKMLMFAHGFNIHYGQIVPPKDVDVT
ncbi:MAG: NAD(P)-dependent oxidoreductase, partial [Chloroflexota bacterium]